MTRAFGLLVVVALSGIAPAAYGIKGNLIEFPSGNAYIYEDGSGNLMFVDAVFTTPGIQMSDCVGTTVSIDHGNLAGLTDDDHANYLTTGRHTAAHSSAYNNALTITGDVGGNATLGAHVADGDVHYAHPAGIYEVDSTGARQYASITVAAAAADDAGGGTILVWPGTYTETFTLAEGVNLIGLSGRSAETRITSDTQGSVVVTAAGDNYIANVSIYNSATGYDQNSAVRKVHGGSKTLKLEQCYLQQTNGWGLLSTNAAGTIQCREVDFAGGDRQVYATGIVEMFGCYCYRTESTTRETLSIRDASQTWHVRNCIFKGNDTQVGLVKFYTASGGLYIQNCNLYGGSDAALFQSDTAAGEILSNNVNALVVGSDDITYNRYEVLGQTFSGQLTLKGHDGETPLVTYPSSAVDYMAQWQDATGAVVAYIAYDGTYWPDPSGAWNRLYLTAQGAVSSTPTKQKRSLASGVEMYELEFDDTITGVAWWTFVGLDVDQTTDTLYCRVYYECETSAATTSWSLATCNVSSGSALSQTPTWSSAQNLTPAGSAVLSISDEFEVTPDWGTSERDLVSIGLRREIADDNTGVVNVFGILLRWQR